LNKKLLNLGFGVLLILLAVQAEPVTATLGFIAGGLFLLATLASWSK